MTTRDPQTIEQEMMAIVQDMTADWDTGFESSISSTTTIIDDLGFESIDVVHLITAIEQKYERRDLPFEELLMVDGRYKEDFDIAEIAAFLTKHL